MRDYAKLAFNCNTLPSDVEQTNAYFRRFLIVPFEVTVPVEKQDPFLAKKIIAAELSGVFNRVLAGLNRMLKNNAFTKSDRVEKEIENFKKESDSVWLFLDENNYVPSTAGKERLKTLYTDYRACCIENGCRPLAIQHFSRRIRHLNFGVVRERNGRVVYLEKKLPEPEKK